MKRLLVTGASGLLGWNVCAVAQHAWHVLGVVNRRVVDLPGAERLRCDLARAADLRQLFRDAAPDGVVHCAAAAQPDFCETRADETRSINVDVPTMLAELCAGVSIPYVFVSTDLVFDGTRAPYAEGAPVSPISVYGRQKTAAEGGVRDRCPHAVVARLPLMCGHPGPVATSFIHPWIAALREGRELSLFTDEFRTPVGVGAAAKGLLMALELPGGTLHLGGPERLSRHDMGLLLAGLLGADVALIKSGRRQDRTVGAPRPADVSLDSSRARAMGYNAPGLREVLTDLLHGPGMTV